MVDVLVGLLLVAVGINLFVFRRLASTPLVVLLGAIFPDLKVKPYVQGYVLVFSIVTVCVGAVHLGMAIANA